MKLTGNFTFSAGSERFQTPVFVDPSIDEQIELAKLEHALRMQDLEDDYERRRLLLREEFAKAMAELGAKKAAQESS